MFFPASGDTVKLSCLNTVRNVGKVKRNPNIPSNDRFMMGLLQCLNAYRHTYILQLGSVIPDIQQIVKVLVTVHVEYA